MIYEKFLINYLVFTLPREIYKRNFKVPQYIITRFVYIYPVRNTHIIVCKRTILDIKHNY